MPASRLLQASVGARITFSPVVDGGTLPHLPFEPGAPDLAADVPVLIGTTETEGTYNAADLVEMDDAAMRTRLGAPDVLGSDAGRILEDLPAAAPARHTGRAVFHDSRHADARDQAGGAQGGSGRGAGLPLADQLADAGAGRLVSVPALRGAALRVRQRVARAGDGRHRSRDSAAGRQDERGLGGVCAHRQSGPRRNPALAAVPTPAAVRRW